MFIRGKNDITIDYSISLQWELPLQLQFYTEGLDIFQVYIALTNT